ncbi:hypothetical protein GLOIN_2v1762040 [Rhizophagus irregularis DAOM 181602=DAOM 197198]|uniref:Uncharacterized protein n=1 Tax=Rhizophagus irregularis (strain DAOM 181602 / DAOM 197198 / MUCL 43194) TaxID=747089 RepID=A0A2P4QYD3_RHIID|nr:hypothetical protein GLOIN_2v1762040 [Rhizophagus irregularis DAOM 181602=DAOM 197198]POG82647.1 hypothetical protein GLOIN_2v1762040 [Rhizophagus irregularis DAOM 181602=DAOM 197198]|eukprot:XP_025189513.1 hypothetical protein GLOIN_2v1762040 [Rhizophagus irregularis DAOM 181602=DAOM 197198]
MDSKSGTAYEFECEFLGIKAMKNIRKCHEVKMCSHSAEELNSSHDSVKFKTNTYKNIYNTYKHSIEKYTINFFVICSKTSCQFINCNGSPKICRHKVLSEGSSTKYFIGCNRLLYMLSKLFWDAIIIIWDAIIHSVFKIPLNVNIERLKELFQNYNFYANSTEKDFTSNTALDNCYTVLPYNSKNKKCYFPHKFSNNTVTNGGLIIHKPCQVRFYYLQSIMNDENLSNLTARKFLTKLTLLTYLNGLSLNSIHPSLNNQSKVNYLIAKEKRSKHPHRQNIFSTVHEFIKNKDLDDAYICKITLTFARVFTNNESVDAYQNMFAAVFSVVKEDTNSEICFYHIDGKGIGCILKYQTKSKIPTEIKKMMYAIPHFETKAKVLNVLEQIKLIQNKQAIDWVNNKSKECSLAEPHLLIR